MSAQHTGSAEADHIRRALHSVADFYDLRPGFDRFLREVPVAQRRCLVVLGGREGATMQGLAEQLGAKAPAMSQVIDRLVGRGLVERRADEVDRRVCRLYLTTDGRAMVQDAREGQDLRLANALEKMDPNLRESLLRGLEALIEHDPAK